MQNKRDKIYLAGPHVYSPNAKEIGERLKHECELCETEGIFPLDVEVSQNSSKDGLARELVYGNLFLIRDCDYVFADLENFRGTDEYPQCDSATAWICGYAVALHKKVIGYTNETASVPKDIANHIHLLVKTSQLYNIFDILNKVELRDFRIRLTHKKDFTLNQPPISSSIKDVNARTAFWLGYEFALGKTNYAKLSDTRPMIEKYGGNSGKDVNGLIIEDFGYSVPAVIALNTIV